MKVCTKCGIEKDESEFYPRRERNSLRPWCKQCCREYNTKNRPFGKGDVPRPSQEEGVVCCLCPDGELFHTLGRHLQAHHNGLTCVEYRRRYGLPTTGANRLAIFVEQNRDRGIARNWTRERIRAALSRWAERHGRAPTTREWDRSRGIGSTFRTHSSARPSAPIVRREFGTWAAALEAAGLEPAPRRPRRRTRCTHDLADLANRYPSGGCKLCDRILRQRLRDKARLAVGTPCPCGAKRKKHWRTDRVYCDKCRRR